MRYQHQRLVSFEEFVSIVVCEDFTKFLPELDLLSFVLWPLEVRQSTKNPVKTVGNRAKVRQLKKNRNDEVATLFDAVHPGEIHLVVTVVARSEV